VNLFDRVGIASPQQQASCCSKKRVASRLVPQPPDSNERAWRCATRNIARPCQSDDRQLLAAARPSDVPSALTAGRCADGDRQYGRCCVRADKPYACLSVAVSSARSARSHEHPFVVWDSAILLTVTVAGARSNDESVWVEMPAVARRFDDRTLARNEKEAAKAPSSDNQESTQTDYQLSGVHLTGDEGPPLHWM
jgi:hypothetical protein